jgi:hypothetical protein
VRKSVTIASNLVIDRNRKKLVVDVINSTQRPLKRAVLAQCSAQKKRGNGFDLIRKTPQNQQTHVHRVSMGVPTRLFHDSTPKNNPKRRAE